MIYHHSFLIYIYLYLSISSSPHNETVEQFMLSYFQVLFQDTFQVVITWLKSYPNILWNCIPPYRMVGNWRVTFIWYWLRQLVIEHQNNIAWEDIFGTFYLKYHNHQFSMVYPVGFHHKFQNHKIWTKIHQLYCVILHQFWNDQFSPNKYHKTWMQSPSDNVCFMNRVKTLLRGSPPYLRDIRTDILNRNMV